MLPVPAMVPPSRPPFIPDVVVKQNVCLQPNTDEKRTEAVIDNTAVSKAQSSRPVTLTAREEGRDKADRDGGLKSRSRQRSRERRRCDSRDSSRDKKKRHDKDRKHDKDKDRKRRHKKERKHKKDRRSSSSSGSSSTSSYRKEVVRQMLKAAFKKPRK